MNHISRVLIKGYKSLHNTETTFCEGLNVIIGANGSGKTNFVKALCGAHSAKETINFEDNFYAEIDLYLGYSGINSMEIIIKTQKKQHVSELRKKFINNNTEKIMDIVNQYDGMLVSKKFDYGIPNSISFFSQPEQIELKASNPHIVIKLENRKNDMFIRENLEYDFNKNNFEDINETELKSIALDFFKLDNELIQYLENHTPVQDVRVNPYNIFVGKNRGVWNVYGVLFEFLVDGEWFRWNDLSDGTQRSCYLVGTVYNHQKNGAPIFIEEPELGIHPHQLQKLMEFVKTQAKEKQIIITTHSPEVLNHCITSEDLDRIIIAKMTDDGTKLYHLDEKQKAKTLKYLKNELSIADYWLHSDLEK